MPPPDRKSRVAFYVSKNNFKNFFAVRNILRFWPWDINSRAPVTKEKRWWATDRHLLHAHRLHAGQWTRKSRSLPGQSHLRKNSGIFGCTSETDFNDPGLTWSESQTALSKLFRLTKPFAKRKRRTAETVRPSRPIAFVSYNSSLWEGSKYGAFLLPGSDKQRLLNDGR